jgi:hypothetical protein
MHHRIQEALLQQELRALKALRQLLPDRLLDHPRSGKTDQRPGSAIFKSPSIAKLAVTPPVVGSVSTQM